MRVLFSVLFVLAGCGASATKAGPAKPGLATGDGIYLARLNPAPCLHATPELQVELKIGAAWERVWLATGDEELDLEAQLLARFERAPRAHLRLSGDLGRRVMRYGGAHFARTFAIESLDPPAGLSDVEQPDP